MLTPKVGDDTRWWLMSDKNCPLQLLRRHPSCGCPALLESWNHSWPYWLVAKDPAEHKEHHACPCHYLHHHHQGHNCGIIRTLQSIKSVIITILTCRSRPSCCWWAWKEAGGRSEAWQLDLIIMFRFAFITILCYIYHQWECIFCIFFKETCRTDLSKLLIQSPPK